MREKGFDVSSIGIENPSITDAEIMTIAIKEERTILTFDRDYGELIFRLNYKPKSGVVFLRLESYSPIEPSIIIEELIKSSLNLTNALTVVDQHGVRQRKYV